MHVLLIEDSRVQAAAIMRALTTPHVSVFWFGTIEDAIEGGGGQRFDVVLLDVHVDEENALDHLDRLKQVWPGSVFVAMTAASTDDLANARKAGCEFVWNKSFGMADLLAIVADVQNTKAGGAPKPSVLIVDDSPTTLKVLKAMAEKAGLRAMAASSAEEALQRIQWDRIDCVLIDVFMPGLGGIEGIKQLRDAAPNLGIIAMSAGFGDSMSFEKALLAAQKIGAHRALKKPFAEAEMAEAVRFAVASQSAAASAGVA